MSKSFDYISAWCDVARPKYDALPADVRQLFLDTAIVAKDLRQGPDLAMIWPDPKLSGDIYGTAFRTRFEKIPAEWLALAAQVIHNLGHWHPSDRDVPEGCALDSDARAACRIGAHWKFSHYADQVLRGKLGLAESGDRYSANGVHLAVHEGAIRICYSSNDMWTWTEVAPATGGGKSYADVLAGQLRQAVDGKSNTSRTRARDDAAYDWFEQIKALPASEDGWPENWRPFVNIGDRYMREEGLRGKPEVRTKQLTEKAAALPAEYEHAIELHNTQKRTELAGRVWCLSRGIDDENLIYYTHTKRFCFGWREPVGPELLAAILAIVSAFPWLYEIKVGRCELYPNGAHLKNEE